MGIFLDIFVHKTIMKHKTIFDQLKLKLPGFSKRRTPAHPSARYHSRDLSYLEYNTENMNRLFEKVKVFMENNNPYLYGSFSIGELSQKIYANRTHVSKAINRLAGMNYSTFVNTYRVKHAADLIAKDPRMKMEEVAKLSGFNTIPTFNSAFKAIMNERPSEYQAKVQKR